MPARPRAVLLRSPADPDPYCAAFDQAGFDARCIPVLLFEPVAAKGLAARLQDAGRFGGLILTSPRAAGALDAYDLAAWQQMPTFVVGPGTAERVRALGLRPIGEEAGTAEALARVIVESSPDRPLLFLAGEHRRDALPDALRAASVPFEECTVYRTVAAASPLLAIRDDLPDWFVFFSPSGVEAALELGGISWNSVARAAIGPTTAEALRSAGLPPHAVAPSPTPEALAAAVYHAHRSLHA